MYRLLVVDDEEYAVEGIIKGIDWDTVGITSVSGVYSVDEAKREMECHPADVIVCDIEMSGENGLDFLKWVREKGYHARLIFLTGYARFEYAQESVGLGASEFLIKPVSHEQLKDAVREALRQYQAEMDIHDRVKEYEKYRIMWEEQIPLLRNRFWQDVIDKPEVYIDQDYLKRMLDLYRIELPDGLLTMVLVHFESDTVEDERENSLNLYHLRSLAENILLADTDGEVLISDAEHLIVLFYRPSEFSYESIEQFTQTAKTEIDCQMEYYVSTEICYTEVYFSYERLKAAENQKSFSDRRFVTTFSEDNLGIELLLPSAEILLAYMETGKREELKKVTGDFLAALSQSQLPVKDNLRLLYYRLISAAITFLYSRGEDMNRHSRFGRFDESVCENPHAFHEWSDDLIDYVVPNVTAKEIPELIKIIKTYISGNLTRDLTRESIAKHVFLNPSYLSRLFHRETGEKLSDYILRMRIERAKELLYKTDEKITWISEQIGYSNDSYFIKVFKAATGNTPYEYRKKSRKGMKA